jgi:RNA polymerase sigma-70 factor (ECF subfamily)
MTGEHGLLDAARNGGQGAFARLVGPYLAQPRACCHRIAGPSADPDGEAACNREVTWLQPFPSDPASIVETRATMRLALVAAFQHQPPRQRAVLILRDVLEWRAAEVARLLDMSTTAVNSALQRARAQLPVVPDDVAEPSGPKRRALLDRCVTAFETPDVNGLAVILTEDASWEMPPIPTWFAGRDTVAAFSQAGNA